MPILNKPDMNYGIWADGGNVERPSSDKIEEGWVIEKPLNEYMNWLQNRQDRMLQYINERGIPEWDSRTQYPLDAYVARSGVLYKAISPNTDNDPTLHTNIWQIAFVSQTDFDNYLDRLNKIESKEGYLGLYVSKASPVLTGVAKGVAYNNSTGVSGLSFDGLKPKVTNSGSTVAEFSGGTNPKDVVTHEQLAIAIQNYKVGDIYITTADGNPSARLGYGSWERFAKGRTLVGFTDEVSNEIPEWLKTNGEEYGSFTHTLKTEELPSAAFKVREAGYFGAREHGGGGTGYASADTRGLVSLPSTTTGWRDQPHNIVQPSIVVYFWKRTA